MKQNVRNRPAARGSRRWLARIAILFLLIIGVFAALPFFTPSVETLAMGGAARAGTDGECVALSDGIVHYEASGPEGAPSVVFIHGVTIPEVRILSGTLRNLIYSSCPPSTVCSFSQLPCP